MLWWRQVLGEFVATLARYHNEVYGTNLSVSYAPSLIANYNFKIAECAASFIRGMTVKDGGTWSYVPCIACQVADFHSYDFVDVWGGTREEANAKVLDFFESSHFKVRPSSIPVPSLAVYHVHEQHAHISHVHCLGRPVTTSLGVSTNSSSTLYAYLKQDELPPIPEALSTLRELKATHQGAVDFHLVTSRQVRT